ncbi:FAD/NAD(P)-binding protein [Labrys monachus]|uniref:NAD(P)/FAD-binding protein YdhS n=1 Tax=Labrys monachus TaxID=217067 RepID=A0ABU0F9Z3_9HYPH|nr:FAD/NAD(P)-binding protein [Labrys monachus]MDQ0391356.1 putative NAD(P)/FAD-binding protein YdhS [Labrys monachus]
MPDRPVPAANGHLLIIGGGASGVLMAAHLLRSRQPALRVTLVEKSPELGAGIAYGTSHPDHLLNVRAANMSAYPDDPVHFWRWVAEHSSADCPDPQSFAPRRLFRDYLSDLLGPHLVQKPGTKRLAIIHDEVVGLEETPEGLTARFAGREPIRADIAILATGNEGPKLPPAPWRFDGWFDIPSAALSPDADVAIIGTGLTMTDRVLSLLHAGHRGRIVAISRHGLLPQRHRPVPVLRLDAADIPYGAGMSYLTHWLRRLVRDHQARGGDWRSVVDGLRPHSQTLWRSLTQEARRRFLRHARTWWDTHRHRMAPAAADRIEEARRTGQLTVIAGRVTGFEPGADGVVLRYVARTGQRERHLHAGAVFECRGRASDIRATENPVLRQLLAAGSVRPDPLGLGLDVGEDCAAVRRDGTMSGRIYAVGPVTSGVFWEIVAVPDIRQQAAMLAGRLLGHAGSR